jgi:hypothetical protein
MVVRTTNVLLIIFVETSFRPDEFASRPDALKLIRVFMNIVYIVIKLGVSSVIYRSLHICLGYKFCILNSPL